MSKRHQPKQDTSAAQWSRAQAYGQCGSLLDSSPSVSFDCGATLWRTDEGYGFDGNPPWGCQCRGFGQTPAEAIRVALNIASAHAAEADADTEDGAIWESIEREITSILVAVKP